MIRIDRWSKRWLGSGILDERKYPDPDRFDIRRKPSGHLAFGRGEHVRIGMNLARIRMRSLFEALSRPRPSGRCRVGPAKRPS